MTNNHPFIDDDIILIEFTDTGGGYVKAGRVEDSLEDIKKNSQIAMNLAMGTIRATAHRVGRTIQEIERDLLPSEVEVEFAIKLEVGGSAETGQVTSLIAKADASGNASGQFTVKFKWNVEKPKAAEVLVSKQV